MIRRAIAAALGWLIARLAVQCSRRADRHLTLAERWARRA